MCHIISGAIPRNVQQDSIQNIVEEFSMNFSPLDNQHITRQIPNDMSYVLATHGFCNCGTALGSLNREKDTTREHLPLEIRELKKKGWSNTKIERWKKDKLKAEDNRTTRTQTGGAAGFDHFQGANELTHWILFLNKMLSEGKYKSIGLLLHWYSGDISTEKFSLKIVKAPIKHVDENFLKKIAEDTFYLFS
jgi:hypothetical protein